MPTVMGRTLTDGARVAMPRLTKHAPMSGGTETSAPGSKGPCSFMKPPGKNMIRMV